MYLKNKKQRERKEQEFVENNPTCPCGNHNEYNRVSYDHIIPQFFLMDLGIDTKLWYDEENSQTLCNRCNNRKAHHLDFNNPKTKPLLLKYLELTNL